MTSVSDEALDLNMICNDRPRNRGVLRNREHEAGVVGPRVIVESCSRESALCDPWLSLPGLRGRKPRSARQRLFLRQEIVHVQTEAEERPARTVVRVRRDEERERVDEARGVPEQEVPLSDGSPDEAESIVPQVSEAPVDQPRCLAARPGGEVAPIDEGRGEAATRDVSRDTRADDSAAHHEDVERFLPHPLQVRGARSSRELRHGDPIARVGSHSALDVCDGAVEEGFPPLVVCEKGRETPYARYFHAMRDKEGRAVRGMVDEAIVLSKFQDVLSEKVQDRLRKSNAVFIPNRSFSSYCDLNEIERAFMVPLFGSRNLLRTEEREEGRRHYWIL